MEDFDRCLNAVDDLLPARDSAAVFLGLDANSVLGCDELEPYELDICLGPCRSGCRDARGVIFAQWLHQRALSASSTFKCSSNGDTYFTRFPDDHAQFEFVSPRQLDYIITDQTTHILRHVHSSIEYDIHESLASDHCPVGCCFKLRDVDTLAPLVLPKSPIPARKQNRWKPHDPESLVDFGNHFKAQCLLVGEADISIQGITDSIICSGETHGKFYNSRAAVAPRSRRTISVAEQTSLSQRKAALTREERSRLTKQVWRQRRKDKCERNSQIVFERVHAGERPVFRKALRSSRNGVCCTTEASPTFGT